MTTPAPQAATATIAMLLALANAAIEDGAAASSEVRCTETGVRNPATVIAPVSSSETPTGPCCHSRAIRRPLARSTR